MFDLCEDKYAKNEKLIKELLHRHQEQEEKLEVLLTAQQLSLEELEAYMEKPENFRPEQWEAIQQMRRELQNQISHRFREVKDPIQAKRSYNDLKNARQWISVR